MLTSTSRINYCNIKKIVVQHQWSLAVPDVSPPAWSSLSPARGSLPDETLLLVRLLEPAAPELEVLPNGLAHLPLVGRPLRPLQRERAGARADAEQRAAGDFHDGDLPGHTFPLRMYFPMA